MRHAPGVGLAAPQLGEALERGGGGGRATGSWSWSTRGSSGRKATTGTSRGACRFPGSSPTSRGGRRSGWSPRTGIGQQVQGRRRRAARTRAAARAGPPPGQALHRLPRLAGRADPGRRRWRRRRGRRGVDAELERRGIDPARAQGGLPRLTSAPAPATVFFGSGAFAVPVLEAVAGRDRACPRRRRDRAAPAGRAARGACSDAGRARAAATGLPVLTPDRLRDPAFLEPRWRPSGRGRRPGRLRQDPAGGGARPAAPRDPEPASLAAAPPPRGDADPGGHPGGRRGDRGHAVPDGRRDGHAGPLVARATRTPLGGRRGRARPRGAPGRTRRPRCSPVASAPGSRRAAARPQPEAGVTVTRPLRRDDGRLDPPLPAAILERRVRAHRPWPGSFLELPERAPRVVRAGVAAPALGRRARASSSPMRPARPRDRRRAVSPPRGRPAGRRPRHGGRRLPARTTRGRRVAGGIIEALR